MENAAVRKWVAQAEEEAFERERAAALAPPARAPLGGQPARRRPRVELEVQRELTDEALSEEAGEEAGDEAPTPRRRSQCRQLAPAEETPRHIHVTLLSAAAIKDVEVLSPGMELAAAEKEPHA
uniref:Uncharacterized protein n=1 Tax=Alexandrium catenella TaxID=2925 RepID=A0A7S1RYF6_ALECA